MKHIVAFSGGLASAVVAKIIATRYPKDTILLYHATNTEPPDNDRFRYEVANYIGLPITEDSDGRDIWEVFRDTKYLGNNRHDPCSRVLKRERTLKYVQQVQKDWIKENIKTKEINYDEVRDKSCILYYGFCYGVSRKEGDESHRAQTTFARYFAENINTAFPLLENKITKEECEHRVVSCWDIARPQMYELYEHANCIPCVKGKKAYWGVVNMFNRTAWVRAVEAERVHGFNIFTNTDSYKIGNLQEEEENCLRLARKYLGKKKQKDDQSGLFEFPCECAV